ncbi:MAG TPA: hypothetical protein VK766_06985 [Cytophagaceae bacterium]|jgi:hypothetical protein|nr:hypothetical protein [Cytophagaceae bacterium]
MESEYDRRVRKILINTAIVSAVSIITYLLYSTIEKNKIISEKNQQLMMDSMTIVAKVGELKALKNAYEKLEQERDSFGLTNDSLALMVSTLNSYIAEVQKKDSLNTTKIWQLNTIIKTAKRTLIKEKKELVLIEETNKVETIKIPATKKVFEYEAEPSGVVSFQVDQLELEPVGKNGKVLKKDQYTKELVKHIRLKFVIVQNELSKEIQKIFSIQLIEPDGNPYKFNPEFDYIKLDNQKVHLTNRKKIEFYKGDTKVSFFYPKSTPFKPGKNTIQLYCENKLMSEQTIEIK